MIDIEGAELECLKGANSLLSSTEKNVFIMGVCINEHQPDGTLINPKLVETFSLMDSHGYIGYTIDSDFRKVALSEVNTIQSSGIDTLGVHNFLFIKSDKSLSEIGLWYEK